MTITKQEAETMERVMYVYEILEEYKPTKLFIAFDKHTDIDGKFVHFGFRKNTFEHYCFVSSLEDLLNFMRGCLSQ